MQQLQRLKFLKVYVFVAQNISLVFHTFCPNLPINIRKDKAFLALYEISGRAGCGGITGAAHQAIKVALIIRKSFR